MKKYKIKKNISTGVIYIFHNLEPKLKIQVIQNDNFEYNKWNDIYSLFKFKGDKFALILVDADFKKEEFNRIRSIIRRAFYWYRSQVYK